uniref:Helicase n=1 Tax=viral metagenome TaxID=1070528 RepID=A0A6C0DZ88_9ZZZZ
MAQPIETTQKPSLPLSYDDFEDMTFLNEELFQGVCNYGFKYPSQIQSKTIHLINAGHDVIAQSQSGSGKTGAFAIGGLSRLTPGLNRPEVIIVANTRDLALQIHKVVENIAKYMKIKIVTAIGGYNTKMVSYNEIKMANVIVGTPGRLCELLRKNVFDGKLIKTLIMDETDVLLKDNFRPQIVDIVSALGKETQMCIFSATFTKETLQVTDKFMRNPYKITIEQEEVSVKNITQFRIELAYDKNKFGTFMDLFSNLIINQVIVFVNHAKHAEELRNRLMDKNIQVGLIHGKNQDRDNILKEFRLSNIKVLISTDLLCRGIDIDDLRLVINYDMPNDPETYIHRVGRSGRFGGHGVAISFCTYDDMYKVNKLSREYKLDIQEMPDPDDVNEILSGMKPSDNKVSSSKNYS